MKVEDMGEGRRHGLKWKTSVKVEVEDMGEGRRHG